jgi:hypothetical protein
VNGATQDILADTYYRCNGKSRGKMNLESSMKESF